MRRYIGTLALAMAFAAPSACAVAQDAAPPAASSVAPAPAAPDAVTGLAAWERLKGNTIEGKTSGDNFAEFFDAGGGVKYVDKDGLSTGTWTVKGDKVCFDFPDDDDRSCSSFSVTGTSGTSTDDDGSVLRFAIVPGNDKGL